ncbi:swr complex subunit [Microbotryomycetes sp. JL201]|nr:swr complex subunit [Microbotryomycetes sp. JL201]
MTSQDVRDIMSISQPSPAHGLKLGQPPQRRSTAGRSSGPPQFDDKKRPTGIARELYALIGDNAPSLALAPPSKPKFKDRIKRSGAQIHWRLSSFTNPSRGAGEPETDEKLAEARKKLQLRHWVRDLPTNHVEGALDTKFQKFNTSSQPYSYTSDEYEQYLKDPSWTKEETDHLFELAHQYDLRFIVMADRWSLPTERTVDMLKARYYSVCRSLIANRPRDTDKMTPEEKERSDRQRQELLASFHFDINRETERKAYLRSLLSRTPQQIADEDFLYIESRRLEQSYNKMAAERAELLKILGGREGIGAQGGVQVGAGGGVKGANVRDGDRKRKSQPGWEFEGLNGAGLPEGWAGEGSKRKATAAQDAANCIERHPAPSVSAPKANPWPSVGVRSSRIAPVKSGVANKVSAALTELGFSTHLIMPTKGNIEKLEQLQTTLAHLIELKKAADRIEGELRTVNKKKNLLLGIEEEPDVKREDGDDGRGDRESSAAARNKRSASASSNPANKRARH